MASLNLIDIRKKIENKLNTELKTAPPVFVVFSNMDFDSKTKKEYVQCIVSFGNTTFETVGFGFGTNVLSGLVTINIYTEEGTGTNKNFQIAERIRNLFNRIEIEDVRFDPPIGPEIFTSTIEGKFQTQIRITFEVVETLP